MERKKRKAKKEKKKKNNNKKVSHFNVKPIRSTEARFAQPRASLFSRRFDPSCEDSAQLLLPSNSSAGSQAHSGPTVYVSPAITTLFKASSRKSVTSRVNCTDTPESRLAGDVAAAAVVVGKVTPTEPTVCSRVLESSAEEAWLSHGASENSDSVEFDAPTSVSCSSPVVTRGDGIYPAGSAQQACGLDHWSAERECRECFPSEASSVGRTALQSDSASAAKKQSEEAWLRSLFDPTVDKQSQRTPIGHSIARTSSGQHSLTREKGETLCSKVEAISMFVDALLTGDNVRHDEDEHHSHGSLEAAQTYAPEDLLAVMGCLLMSTTATTLSTATLPSPFHRTESVQDLEEAWKRIRERLTVNYKNRQRAATRLHKRKLKMHC